MQVLFIDTVHPILEERLTAKGMTCIDGTSWSRKDCINKLPEMDGIVIRSRFPMNEEFLHHGKNLKFILRSGAGMENIDLNYTEKHNIQCFNAPEGNRNAVENMPLECYSPYSTTLSKEIEKSVKEFGTEKVIVELN